MDGNGNRFRIEAAMRLWISESTKNYSQIRDWKVLGGARNEVPPHDGDDSGKDDGLVAIHQDLVRHVPPEGLGENGLLEILSETDEVGDAVVMRDLHDILVDDGPLVEFGGDV